jgi:hypothetical protein
MDLRAFPGMDRQFLGIDHSPLSHPDVDSLSLAPEVGRRRSLEAVGHIASRHVETDLY